MNNIPQVTTDEYFGGCPECGGCDEHLNVERTHWGMCHKHKTKWRVGENLFSSWRDEHEAVWEKNKNLLESYRQVEPLTPPTEECPRCGQRNIVGEDGYHHPLCRAEDGTLTDLSDDTVRAVLKLLEDRKYHLEPNALTPDEIPF